MAVRPTFVELDREHLQRTVELGLVLRLVEVAREPAQARLTSS